MRHYHIQITYSKIEQPSWIKSGPLWKEKNQQNSESKFHREIFIRKLVLCEITSSSPFLMRFVIFDL